MRILTLKLPPLRERDEDSLLLARVFFARCKQESQCKAGKLDESTCGWFSRYQWPGNVRELEGLVYREAMISDEETLRLDPPGLFFEERRNTCDRRQITFDGIPYSTARSMALEQFDRHYIANLMEQAKGNVTHAARIAGKERRALGKLLKKRCLSGRDMG